MLIDLCKSRHLFHNGLRISSLKSNSVRSYTKKKKKLVSILKLKFMGKQCESPHIVRDLEVMLPIAPPITQTPRNNSHPYILQSSTRGLISTSVVMLGKSIFFFLLRCTSICYILLPNLSCRILT